MKSKIKLRKKIRLLLSIILVIIVSYATITLFKNYQNSNYNFFIPTFNETITEQSRKLEELHYSSDEIKIITKNVSEENINYLIENKIIKTSVVNIVKEKYFIDKYLKDYINFYNSNQNKKYSEIISIINTHSNDNENKIITDTSKDKFTIINKYYYVDKNYPKEDTLVSIDSKYHLNNTETKINKETYEAFLKMYEEAPNDSKFKIKNAYKSYQVQEATHNIDPNNNNESYAKQGYSEHQTGYALDLESNEWLKENAYKYGFILRYPKDKEELTGYPYSKEHYRYCGITCATYIYENNITFDEYYEYFVKFNNPNNLS